MPKLEAQSITLKISLSQIIDTGNIREIGKYGPNEKGEYPPEIIDLAQSIKTIGQIQPVIVKLAGEADGVKQYELIAGFRRRAAFQYLCSTGEDFSMIDAKIITGEKLVIQLVENIQREDLTAPEREAAVFQLAENGLKQKEIAAQLSKTPAYVSLNISAYKMRQAAQKAKINLSGIETSTLSELLSVPDGDLLFILRKLAEAGGTRAVAAALAAPYKKGKEAPPPARPSPPQSPTKPQGKPGKPPARNDKPIEADHRVVDVNIVLTVIFDYIKKINYLINGSEKTATMNDFAKIEAAKDILALIHKRLDDA